MVAENKQTNGPSITNPSRCSTKQNAQRFRNKERNSVQHYIQQQTAIGALGRTTVVNFKHLAVPFLDSITKRELSEPKNSFGKQISKMNSIPSIANCSLLPILVLLSPWSFASFAAEASAAIAEKSPFKIVSSILCKVTRIIFVFLSWKNIEMRSM